MNSTKRIYSWLTEHDELTFVACDDFELMDQFGEMIKLSDFCEQVVVLVAAAFW